MNQLAIFEKSIARLFSPDNQPIGAGFLVGKRALLACSHVVSGILDLPDDTFHTPTGEIILDFPLISTNDKLVGQVIHWNPPDNSRIGDIAILELKTDPPIQAQIVNLILSNELWGHSFRAFGFPSGHVGGIWATGVLRSRLDNGWVQIEAVNQPGYRVKPGFSGTPIWDEQLNGIVGMAIAAETRPEIKAAFMVPTNSLVTAWPKLENIAREQTNDYFINTPAPTLSSILSVPDVGPIVGRDSFIEQTVITLKQNKFIVVQGLAGIGKTSIITQLVQCVEAEYEDIAWIKCDDSISFDYILIMLATFLAQRGEQHLLSSIVTNTKLCSPDVLYSILLDQLRNYKLLLVFDGFDKALDRNRYIADIRLQKFFYFLLEMPYNSRIILSSRFWPKFPHNLQHNYTIVQLSGLSKDASRALLQTIGNTHISDNDFLNIYDSLKGHPFALKILVSLSSFYPLDTLLRDKQLFLDECGRNLLNKLLQSIQPNEYEWTRKLSVLRGHFQLETFLGLGGPLPMIELLVSRFILDFDYKNALYYLHPLVRDFTYTRLTELARKQHHINAATHFSSKFSLDHINTSNFTYAVETSYHYSHAGDLKRTLDIPISFTESLHYLGFLFFKKRIYNKSEQCYESIIKLDESDEKAHFYYAASIDLQGATRRIKDFETIEKHYNIALATRPKSVQYIDYYAFFLMNLSRHEEAEVLFKKGAAIGARCPTLYKRYGLLLKKMKRFTQADEVFSKGCKIAYRNGLVYIEYAKMKQELGLTSEAEDILTLGIQRNPSFQPLSKALDALKANGIMP